MKSNPDYLIRAVLPSDRARVRELITQRWGSEIVVSHRVVYRPHELPGFAAWQGDAMVGMVTLRVVGNSCEIVTLDSLQPGKGIGTALLDAAIAFARQANCTRLWLITTNDNLNALRFYQKRGLVLVTIHRNALVRSKQLKPQIPSIGSDGIPLRDEIELEMMLTPES
jgi:ribosomal protein S18 acetylase RimI-like enzyme